MPKLQEIYGITLPKDLDIDIDKRVILRNMINPELGLHIFNESKMDVQPELFRTKK